MCEAKYAVFGKGVAMILGCKNMHNFPIFDNYAYQVFASIMIKWHRLHHLSTKVVILLRIRAPPA